MAAGQVESTARTICLAAVVVRMDTIAARRSSDCRSSDRQQRQSAAENSELESLRVPVQRLAHHHRRGGVIMRRTGLLRVVIVLIGAGIASVEIGCRSAAAIQDSTTPNIPTALQPAPEPLRRPGAATASLIPGDGMEAVRARCVACHEAAMLLQQRLTAQQWMAEIDKMQGWGASVANEDKHRATVFPCRVPRAGRRWRRAISTPDRPFGSRAPA
jgi:hypothetical protein